MFLCHAYHIALRSHLARQEQDTYIRSSSAGMSARGGIWYRMLIEPQGAAQGAMLLNCNGKPRSWKDLSAAVRFVSRTLQYVQTVTVEVDVTRDRPGGGEG